MNKIIKSEELQITIYVEDTDFQGFVYHANYVKFFERARSNFLSSIKVSQRVLRSKNQAFVIKSINLNYLHAAELGDNLVVHTAVEKKSNARMIFHQKIRCIENKREYVNGKVEVCFIDLNTKKPKKFPDDLLLIFK